MHKILFIIDHLGCGGAERITLQLSEYLAKHGHDVWLSVLNGKRNYYRCSDRLHYIDLQFCENFAYGKMWRRKKLNPQEQQRLDNLLSQSFDVIITGYNNGHWLSPYLKGNVWHWIHGDLLEVRAFKQPFKQMKEYVRFFKHKTKFAQLFHGKNLITVNRDLEEKAKTYTQPHLVKTIANGVDIPSQYMHRSISASKKWDVIFVGRLVPIKQVDHALRAFALCKTHGKMAIVGDGTEKNKLQQLAHELGIANRVDFLGWVEDPYVLMQQSQCLVMCSLYEGSPVTLAEAISLDVPVVSYNSSLGIQDLLSQHRCAFALVEKQNIVALSQAITQCLNTPYHYDEEFKSKVHIDHMAQKILNLGT